MSDINIVNNDPNLVHNLKGHRNDVTSISFHPSNNQQFVSGSLDNSLMLWNLSSQQKRCFKLLGHTNSVNCVEFSKDGSLIASCSQDQTVRLWSPKINGNTTSFRAHTAPITTVSFSPANDKLITGSNDKSIKIWDLATRKFISSFSGHNNWVRCVKFSSDETFIVSCSDDRTLRFWDVHTGQCVHTVTCTKGSGNYLAIHMNDRSIALALNSGSVRVYDMRAKKLQQHYVLHDNATCVKWHPCANYLLTSGQDGTMKFVDVLEGRPLYTVEGHSAAIRNITFTHDGSNFASGGADKHIMVWATNFVVQKEAAND